MACGVACVQTTGLSVLGYGFLSVGNGVDGALGPWFGGAIHDATGSYRVAFLISVLFCAMGAACFWLARPRRRHG